MLSSLAHVFPQLSGSRTCGPWQQIRGPLQWGTGTLGNRWVWLRCYVSEWRGKHFNTTILSPRAFRKKMVFVICFFFIHIFFCVFFVDVFFCFSWGVQKPIPVNLPSLLHPQEFAQRVGWGVGRVGFWRNFVSGDHSVFFIRGMLQVKEKPKDSHPWKAQKMGKWWG